MTSMYAIVGGVLFVSCLIGIIIYFGIDYYNLRRGCDALQRSNAKMREYVNKRDKEGWKPASNGKASVHDQTETQAMILRELQEVLGPDELASRVRKPRPRPRPRTNTE